MYKIAVMGDYDSIYGFATLGLSICPVKDRDEAKTKLRQLAEGNYGIIYITEAVAAQIPSEINKYGEQTFPAIIQIPGVSGNTGAGVEGVKKTVEQAVGSGPLVIAEGMRDANMFDVVRVSEQRLIGEIIEMHGDEASIQVYEETSGLGPGEPVESMDVPMSVELGPGLIASIYDGIQRPLDDIMKISGTFTVEDIVAVVETEKGEKELTMMQKWPVRRGRPYKKKLPPEMPLVTGQRVIDTFFPIAKGGVAAVPGPFGSGKTVIQHQLAKWAEADIVVYIGCGERGNEMTDVLNEFPELKDPKTGQPLMQRTVLIANTSDMPVAAREASIYTGITIAEYFRDMGYSVALMADSTSRWAEALREMSGRLEEMPGEEGYPAYLGSRLAQFYERAGHVVSLGKEGREGALSVIGAVSPPGGDTSEPVSQATLRIVKVFWGLDASLAYKRHFPAINWLKSYSLYLDDMEKWFNGQVAEDWMEGRQKMMTLLQEEAELEEIVKMVGMDALSPSDRLKMEAARSIREDFLHQNSFHEVDTYTSLKKQHMMMVLVNEFFDRATDALKDGASLQKLISMPVREQIGRFKYVTEDKLDEEFKQVDETLSAQIAAAFVKEEG